MSDFKIVKLVDPIYVATNGVAASITGNTAGTPAVLSSGTMYLAGGNNITLSQSQNTVSIVGGAGAGGGIANQAGTQTATSGTVVFSNSNNVTFGMSNSSVVTASASFNQTVQTQNLHNVTLSGNTAGVMAQISSGTLSLAGGNNITLSQNGNAVTISGGAAGGADGVNALVVNGGASTASTTLALSNGNNVTFGHNAGTITASASYSQSTQPVAVSGSNGSFNFSTATFGNLNGMSFYTSNGSMVGSYTVPTVTNSSLTMQAGASTLSSVSRVAFGDSNGVSFGASTSNNGSITITATVKTDYQSSNANYLTSQSNQAVSGQNGSYAFQTLSFSNANGLSFGTSAGSAVTGSYTVPTVTDYFSKTNTTFNGANVSGSLTLNTNGLQVSLSAAAPGGGVNPAASASNGSFAFTTLNFSNANNVTFGTSAGNIVTASVAAPGAAAENNWFELDGANTAGNTTASGSTIGLSGINLTLSGTNASNINISAPATSSLSATGLVSISTNGSTISIGVSQPPGYFYEPYHMLNPLSTTYAPGIGTWHFEAIKAPVNLASGRINALFSMGSTSNLLAASNGTSWASGSTGGISYSFRFDRTVALYSRGAGANSTRLDSVWSNTITNGVSQSVGVSLTNASQLTVARSVSLQYIQSVQTNGAYTTAGLGATHNASYANSSTATSAHTSAISSIMNMMSGAMLVPFGFNTTISAGDYWLGMAYSTGSTTAGTSVNGASIWPQVNQVGLHVIASMSHRQFGATASSTGSQFMPGHGAIFSAVSASPPSTIAFSDMRSVSSHVIPYVNIMQSVAS